MPSIERVYVLIDEAYTLSSRASPFAEIPHVLTQRALCEFYCGLKLALSEDLVLSRRYRHEGCSGLDGHVRPDFSDGLQG